MTKIVYIDSENTVRETYAHLLEAGGYQVLQATTAQYGKWLCQECHPDLVITTRNPVDAELEDGEFVNVLRGVAGRAPVVVVTHRNGSERKSTLRDEHSDPHSYVELMNAIHKALDDGIGELTIGAGQTGATAAS